MISVIRDVIRAPDYPGIDARGYCASFLDRL